MPLFPVPSESGRKLWVDRANPEIWIVLDRWDSERQQYEFHDRDHPDNRGDISPGVLDACYLPLGPILQAPAATASRVVAFNSATSG